MATQVQKQYQTFYFVESHPKSMNKNAEVVLDMKHKSLKPIRKLLERDFPSAPGQEDFTVTVYALDIIPSLLKEKEVKTIKNNLKVFPVKIALKIDKNKFEGLIYSYIQTDSFNFAIKFEQIKKLIGKPIDPPPQIALTNYQFLSLFNEALLMVERKAYNDITYLTFLRLGMSIIKSAKTVPFKLFLLMYEKILNSFDIELLNSILEYFQLNRIEQPKILEELNIFQEPLLLLYDNEIKYIENIKLIPGVNFTYYLIKFYTIHIYFNYVLGNIQNIEYIMVKLRDNNAYDYLILAKSFLSEFNEMYRSIPINQDLKMSFIDSFIQASVTYQNLTTAFSMIAEYIQGDLNIMLQILIKNYDHINKLCMDNNKPFQINQYITQKNNDDLNQVQKSLFTIGQNKLNYRYNAIDFKIEMWDMYLMNGNNPEFLEFLESHLIQTAFNLEEIKFGLNYIIKFTKKNLVTMLQIFAKNYDKLEITCRNEKKSIDAFSYIQPDSSDNIEAIQQNLNYIIARKLKVNYQTIFFKIDIWLFYILNQFNNEFLLYLENKLFEGVLFLEDIIDCLTYATTLREKTFNKLLEVIINNFEKIYIFTKSQNQTIDISKFFIHKLDTDNLEEIYKNIIILIDQEKMKGYKVCDFNIKIWEPYSLTQNLDLLRLIRKIIIKLTEMDNTLNENDILLGKKIHDVGFIYIRQGKLVGEKLLDFLGIEEAFYVEGQINRLIAINQQQQKQLNENVNTIKFLTAENTALKTRLANCETSINLLQQHNQTLEVRVAGLETSVINLDSKITSIRTG